PLVGRGASPALARAGGTDRRGGQAQLGLDNRRDVLASTGDPAARRPCRGSAITDAVPDLRRRGRVRRRRRRRPPGARKRGRRLADLERSVRVGAGLPRSGWAAVLAGRCRQWLLSQWILDLADRPRTGERAWQHCHDERTDARAVDWPGRRRRDADWTHGRPLRSGGGHARDRLFAIGGSTVDAFRSPIWLQL